ncbi:type II toxin-antitoxin system VapC family toxin [Methylococcus geothermalis]|uniref:PIN domain-containing protein n=1 Tax=Methylococcus geothermalis TaxID=2681310 RepID=A0A858Q9M9_9GAMM|nr:type II toxin-antitoxin system VapC family toxin [Methylococcus geothermalis]QJD30608.1 PIN domain-containing protein [Methylococcus geothermalis]
MTPVTTLLDTNVLIYHMNNQGGDRFVDRFRSTLQAGAGISVITRIEVLAWRGHTDETAFQATALLGLCREFGLSESVIQHCIGLRRAFNVKLPDAIIAATAVLSNLPLMTRNTGDFQRIPGLMIVDPFE